MNTQQFPTILTDVIGRQHEHGPVPVVEALDVGPVLRDAARPLQVGADDPRFEPDQLVAEVFKILVWDLVERQ